jgi:hypothetical protein
MISFNDQPSPQDIAASSPGVKWQCGDWIIDKALFQYTCVFVFLFIVGLAALVNLTIGSDHSEIWASILSMLCGVFVPQPRFSKKDRHKDENA